VIAAPPPPSPSTPSSPPGDSVELLDGAAAAYPRMLEAIDAAEVSIHLEMYAFDLDDVGEQFVAALAAAARRGVAVRAIVDGWGSMGSGGLVVSRLMHGGCDATLHEWFGRGGRNHRKLLLVDRRVAFVGGINIGAAFAAWDDLAVMVRGPACEALARAVEGHHGGLTGPVRVLLQGFRSGLRLRREHLELIAGARERLAIAHSYFLPDEGVLRALRRAVRRGVRVAVLVPAVSDVPLAQLATRRLYRRLVPAGVRVHERTGGVLHAKAAVADGRVALVGSFNLDPLSLTNLEVLVRVEEPAFAGAVEDWITRRIERSVRITSTPRRGAMVDRVGDQVGRWVRRSGFWLSRWMAKR
jgi:cardiolipin synthase